MPFLFMSRLSMVNLSWEGASAKPHAASSQRRSGAGFGSWFENQVAASAFDHRSGQWSKAV